MSNAAVSFDPARTSGLRWRMPVAPLALAAAAALFGPFVTEFAPVTPGSWRAWAAARVVWQLGALVWAGLVLARGVRARPWQGAVVGAVVGGMLASNALLDLALGPRVVVGQWTERSAAIAEGTARPPAPAGPAPTRVTVRDRAGATHELSRVGFGAARWSRAVAACGGAAARPWVRVSWLEHLARPLALECAGGVRVE